MSAQPFGKVVTDARSAGFFEAAAAGRLAVRCCVDCGHLLPPAAMVCSQCRGADLGWAEVSGEGTVVSWFVLHGRPGRDGSAPTRTCVVTVELAEGPWINARLVGQADGEAPDAGLDRGRAVRIAFHRFADADTDADSDPSAGRAAAIPVVVLA